jgi:hypothetical protein
MLEPERTTLTEGRLPLAHRCECRPRVPQGVNSAFEDVAVLAEELDNQPSLEKALERYSARRSAEARVLVEMSRSFDRSGLRGFVSFIGPIILDGVFGGLPLLGKAFAPNTLAMLQKPDISFVAIRWRKRFDRALQLALLGTGLTCVAKGIARIVGAAMATILPRVLPTALSRRKWAPLLAVAAAAAATVAVKQLLERPSDVADVLASQTSTAEAGGDQPAGTRPGY